MEKENEIKNKETAKFPIATKAIPFLVKGISIKTGSPVIGFPYVFMIETEEGLKTYNCILLPVFRPTAPDPERNPFATFDGCEIHPISGEMNRFSHMGEDNKIKFEDESVEAEVTEAAVKAVSFLSDETASQKITKTLLMAKFIEGVRWAAEHGVTPKGLKKDDTIQGV